MESHASAGRGRDLAVLTLEIAEAGGGFKRVSSVLCPKQGVKAVDACLPCEDSLGEHGMPNEELHYVGCVGQGAPVLGLGGAQAPGSSADRTPISSVMTRTVLALRADVPLERARALLVERELDSAPVVDADGKPLGAISSAQLLEAGAAALTAGKRVGDVMSRVTIAVPELTSVAETAALLAHENADTAAVLAKDGHVVGAVSALDIVRWLTQQDGLLLPSARSLQAR